MVMAAPEAQVVATIMSFIPGAVGWLAMVMAAIIVAEATTESGAAGSVDQEGEPTIA